MEKDHTKSELLSHFLEPAFYVKDGSITHSNLAAQSLLLTPGTPIAGLISAGSDEYKEFTQGCLYLTMKIHDQLYIASVTAEKDYHLFITQNASDDTSLQAYSLAARELRTPLSGIMMATKKYFKQLSESSDPQLQKQAAYINQHLYRMLRIVSNMSDAGKYANAIDVHLEQTNITSALQEMLTLIESTCAESGYKFRFICPEEPVYGPVDREKLERGVYNLISNALKFAGTASCLEVTVTYNTKRLYITVKDSGKGIDSAIRDTIYHRYRRRPGLEDPIHGIGLGMLLARSTASIHSGALLMEVVPDQGAKITMSISLTQKELTLRSPYTRIDYSGEHDHCLIELSDCLPVEQYVPKNLK